ncbi:ATP-binding protein [Bifidobacterium simiiventris]|uniref:ATP-binding protein n=1 Tax=Bifidobacterium simiiventris TaxID=2834434 RepID=UPI001F3A4A1B|nr:ATP-binding protein [Bifidobacterium simiiventris]
MTDTMSEPTMPDGARDIQIVPDRWMMESRQLVNWGSYDGYHVFRPSTDDKLPVTLLAGASESGKSTLVDAQISLLYPSGTPFNKASNSGRSERSDYTYLRGMIGVGDTDDAPMYLRGTDADGMPHSVWGAIVDTYRNATTGQTLSCGKFLYLMPGEGRGDVRRQYVTWNHAIDPRLMDQFRDGPFTPTQLKATYEGCSIFSNANAFHARIWGVMGLTEEACRLLHKIQSADAPSRLDDIFKQGVLGVPAAIGKAEDLVGDYERYAANFNSMEEKARRMQMLQGIRQSHGQYDQAQANVHAFDVVDPNGERGRTAIRRWALAHMAEEVTAQLPHDERERDRHMQDAAAERAHGDEITARIDTVKAQIQGVDGGSLARLELDLTQAKQTLNVVADNHDRIARQFAAIGEHIPDTRDAWLARQEQAARFVADYERRRTQLDHDQYEAAAARSQANDELDRLTRDYERQRTQRTRISQQMDEERVMLCRATGLNAEELPYVAELMDVREDEETWRTAMNVAYGPIARTILVDQRHEQGFAARVSTIDPHLMSRRTWRFVDTGRDHGNPETAENHVEDGPWLSGKLRYREDSPFVGWLRAQTANERYDALCVDVIDDTDEQTRQVQPDGQIKSGRHGQHGIKDIRQVIGFVNQAYLDELLRQTQDAKTAFAEADQTYEAIRQQAEQLRRGLALAETLNDTDWNSVAVQDVKQRIARIEQDIDTIRRDPKLAELTAARERLEQELDHSNDRRFKAQNAADQCTQAVNAAREWLECNGAGNGDATDAKEGRTAFGDDVAERLGAAYERQFAGQTDPATRAHLIIGAGRAAAADDMRFENTMIDQIGKEIDTRRTMLAAQADAARKTLESQMQAYRDVYAKDDDALTATVADYRYYEQELDSLSHLAANDATEAEYANCLHKLYWDVLTLQRTLKSDEATIKEQLSRINSMLTGQQFGPKGGRLSLNITVRPPERAFGTALRRMSETLTSWQQQSGADVIALRKTFRSCRPFVDMLHDQLAQVKDSAGIKQYGARDLDPRCRSSFYAIVHHEDGPDERITSTGGRSGGALQELTSFVYGAALIYLLGEGSVTGEPSYTTLFLDEALIKADGRYTKRALMVLPRLGFQVIVSAPESKTGEILEVSTKAYVTYKDPDTGHTTLREASLDADAARE